MGVTDAAATPLTSKSAASTPVTGSLKVTVIADRPPTVLPAEGLAPRTVGGLVSTRTDSSEASKSTSLLATALWNTCTASTFEPTTKYDGGAVRVYRVNGTGSVALFASVVTETGSPAGPTMLTRCTSVPLIQATNPSSTSA